MLTHIVLYKTKSGVTDAQVQALLSQARERLSTIAGVKGLRAGTSIYKDEPFQCALVMYFDDREALDKYRVHPAHLKFIEEVLDPIVEKIRRFDYIDE